MRRHIARLDPRHALLRVAIAGGVAVAVTILLGRVAPLSFAALTGWNGGAVVLLAMAWATIWTADADRTQARAAAEDPGRRTVYALVLITSAASLFAAVALANHVRRLGPHDGGPARLLTLLSLLTVALSWTLTHTAFTLRYAHLYYRDDDEGIGGLEFPGQHPPTYSDFAYFAFTVGMAFQVSDVTVSSPQLRRTVLLHAMLSFAYNTAIVAFALNLAFGAA